MSQFIIVSAFFPLTGRFTAKTLRGRSIIPPLGVKHFELGGANIVTLELWRLVGDVQLQNNPKVSKSSDNIVKLRPHILVYFFRL